MPVDGLSALTNPPAIPASSAGAFAGNSRKKYLVPSDRVIGVALGGEARAYPLRVLAWHEIVNDTLAGRPIAITYHPLSEAVAVFDREREGEILEFGVSGLLFQSNLLMYDRTAPGGAQSLLSQLASGALCGPRARSGLRLRTIPCSLARWDEWLERYPQTTVLAPVEAEMERYERDIYGSYFATERLRFPVDPMPPPDSFPPKTRLLALVENGRRRLFPLEFPAGAGPRGGEFEPAPGIRIRYGSRPASVLVEPGAEFPGEMIYAFWFAWYATHPGDPGEIAWTGGPGTEP